MKSVKNILRLIGSVIVVISFTSCSSVKVYSDKDPDVDFTKYRSFEYYGWADKSDQMLNDIDKRRIEAAFANELYSRGLGVVAKDGELVIALHIVVEQRQETTAQTVNTGMGYGGGYGGYYGYGPGYGWGAGHSTTYVTTQNYNVGTLIISVYDKAEEKLIWESTANKQIESDPKKREKNIPYVVAQMMKEYPVPAPKE